MKCKIDELKKINYDTPIYNRRGSNTKDTAII